MILWFLFPKEVIPSKNNNGKKIYVRIWDIHYQQGIMILGTNKSRKLSPMQMTGQRNKGNVSVIFKWPWEREPVWQWVENRLSGAVARGAVAWVCAGTPLDRHMEFLIIILRGQIQL